MWSFRARLTAAGGLGSVAGTPTGTSISVAPVASVSVASLAVLVSVTGLVTTASIPIVIISSVSITVVVSWVWHRPAHVAARRSAIRTVTVVPTTASASIWRISMQIAAAGLVAVPVRASTTAAVSATRVSIAAVTSSVAVSAAAALVPATIWRSLARTSQEWVGSSYLDSQTLFDGKREGLSVKLKGLFAILGVLVFYEGVFLAVVGSWGRNIESN